MTGLKTGMERCHVQVEWDDEAKVWIAFSEDVPGLATGADSIEALLEKLRIVSPSYSKKTG